LEEGRKGRMVRGDRRAEQREDREGRIVILKKRCEASTKDTHLKCGF
jgi:hypothetical protein